MKHPIRGIVRPVLCGLLWLATATAAAQSKPVILQRMPSATAIDVPQPRVPIAIGPQLAMLRAYDPKAYPQEKLYADRLFRVEFVLSGMSGGQLKLEIDRSRYPAGSVEQYGLLSGEVAEGREAKRTLEFRIKQAAIPADGVVRLYMVATLTRAGAAQQVAKFDNHHVIVTRMKKLLWTDTASKASNLHFRLMSSSMAAACEGESATPAGTYSVGMSTRGDKLVFRIRSGPLGTHCTWDATENTSILPYPWRVVALNWTARASDKCQRPDVERSRPLAPPGSLRTNWIAVGNGRQVMADLHLPEDRLPKLLVGLHCDITLLNDHYVETVWENIEVEAPEDMSFRSIYWP